MRFQLLVTFLVGVAFFTVLPIYAPIVGILSEESLLMGLGASVVAGAGLASVAGPAWRGYLLVLACVAVGTTLYVFLNAIPTFGARSGMAPSTYLFIIPSTFVYLFLPAAVGVAFLVLAHSLLASFRRS
jgi:hypothetical protein